MAGGYLPRYLFVIACLAIYNGVQCFVPSMRVTGRIYARAPAEVSPLMCRMMGMWTLTSGIIRLYASYHITNPVAYALCMWTFALAAVSFGSEVFLFRTAPLTSPGVWPAMLISTCSLAWMWSGYSLVA